MSPAPQAVPVYYVDPPELYNPGVTGGYVRHRDRMVQQSVFDDLQDTLIAFGWLSGTTTRPVVNPDTGAWGVMTVAPADVLALLDESPINLIDFFPELEGGVEMGEPATGKTPLNTLALDNGTRMESAPLEMGNAISEEVLYRFTLAFYASSDAIAQALLSDLADRYRGRTVRDDSVELWNYNRSDSMPVVRMSVENFTFTSAADQEVSYPAELKLYFAELLVQDEVDGGPAFESAAPSVPSSTQVDLEAASQRGWPRSYINGAWDGTRLGFHGDNSYDSWLLPLDYTFDPETNYDFVVEWDLVGPLGLSWILYSMTPDGEVTSNNLLAVMGFPDPSVPLTFAAGPDEGRDWYSAMSAGETSGYFELHPNVVVTSIVITPRP